MRSNLSRVARLLPLLGGLLVLAGVSQVMSQPQDPSARRAQARQEFQAGNFNDAYGKFQKLSLSDSAIPEDLTTAMHCLQRLGRLSEIDSLVEDTVAAHPQDWRMLQEAALTYQRIEHHGVLVGGKFERGPHRGGGEVVDAYQRDRVRSLQLMVAALPLAQADDRKQDVARFFRHLAEPILLAQGKHEAWRLQYLTNLEELPDYEPGYRYDHEFRGAPVNEEGQPVFHRLPASWEAAASDGERWRWALEQAVENQPSLRDSIRMELAQFWRSQFGVQTLQQTPLWHFFGLPVDDQADRDESGVYAVHSLGEEETIAKLATGIQRFPLPEEFNYIRLYQQVAENKQSEFAEAALNALAEIFENRRQYPRAAAYWKENITRYGEGRGEWKRKRQRQIEGNWARFEPVGTQPAGQGATVDFRFRNAHQVDYEAHELKVSLLLDDLKAYLKSSPSQLDWNRVNVANIGWRIVDRNQTRYLGEKVASWREKLEPRENHWDRRITVTTPLKNPGAYLLTAKVSGGNTTQIVIWVADTAIVKKQLHGETLYYVADAVSGTPVANANLELFGFQLKHVRGNRFEVLTKNFAESSSAEGQVKLPISQTPPDFQWLAVARTPAGRLAILGFHHLWPGEYFDQEYNETKAYFITDRPVYRPGQPVHFKIWVRKAQYDQDATSEFANRTFPVEIHDPRGQKVLTTQLESDEFAGLEGEYQLPSDATLGAYSLQLSGVGGSSFRVEEYKKPEFEVQVEAPDKPVALGEKISAKLTARYYFGAPVVQATVKYKVMRSSFTHDWYPVMPWDWCFGPGYWWFSYDYPWYPGWSHWVGSRRPFPSWWPRQQDPPEVVAEREVPIGADGTVEIEIDTSLAKAVHGDVDHEYTITAEVRDQSRRTIVGQGKVLVTRKPFEVYTWLERGYYRVGDTIQAHFRAQTADEKPVAGKGTLRLLKVTYDPQRKPIETPVQEWSLDTDEEGKAQQPIQATAPGQFRLSYQVTDALGHAVEGGYLFTITGQGFDGREYRFNQLELIPDKTEYQPGDRVRLQINTDRADSTVLLFVRPANGIYLPPKLLRIRGKSTIEEIGVLPKDMPNFFVEAVTVAAGEAHLQAKEIVVPPENRILNVQLAPDATTYKPGQKARLRVQLTDLNGENFAGTTVLSIYDKALEYISGGSNVPEIKEFFWKWQRHHQPQQETNLDLASEPLMRRGAVPMQDIGVFGGTLADDLESLAEGMQVKAQRFRGLGGGGFGGGMGGMGGMPGMGGGALGMARSAIPMSAPAAAAELADAGLANAEAPAGAPPLVQPTVRTNFADTALWVGSLTTDATGSAEVELTMPENLTTWMVRVWGMGHGTRVGQGQAEVITSKDLLVRLQAPRFFVQTDEVVLSANVHNYLQQAKDVVVALELPSSELEPLGETRVTVQVPADGERRVDFRVRVREEGLAVVRVKALTDEESDAVEMKLPCHVHGILKTEAWAGTLRADQQAASVSLRVPEQRRPEQTVLEVRYSPTLAAAMVDALPYLVDYPYGCTEQTLNRFVPTVITQQVLREMNLNLADIREKRTNLNAQEIGEDRERARQWQRLDRNPVFDEAEVQKMVKKGVTALTNMQLSDGGWGWFSGYGERSYPHTTAVVVHGLQQARQNDVAIVPGVLERGLEWLNVYQQEQVRLLQNAATQTRPWKSHADSVDALIYMILVDAQIDSEPMRDFLYRDRIELPVYAKALFGLALHKLEDREKLTMVLRNIEQFLVQDEENETAWLKLPEGSYWWYWYGSDVEANAYYLKLLARTDPAGQVAPRLVKYLLNNRKHGTYWRSTRDTAICVEAFADYLRATDEARPQMTVEVWLDGQKRQEVQITPENLFSFNNKFVLEGAALSAGDHQLEIRRRGSGAVYFNAYLTNFTLEDFITRAGLEIRVERKFYKLIPADKSLKVAGSRGQPVDQRVEKYERQLLENHASLASGDLVEVELELESKNDYEYLVFEDRKAAGFEPVELQSGYLTSGLPAYMELRDDRVSFFLARLARGRHSVSYRLRAEIPGEFSALPTQGYAMYAPELQANSDEMKVEVQDE